MTFGLAEAKSKAWGRKRASRVIMSDKVIMRGGLNLVASTDQIPAGMLLVGKNYETDYITGAYKRINGHEVFDGQPRPHLAEYWKVTLSGIDGGPYEYGETVTSSTGETALVALYVVDEVESDNSGYLILTDLSNDVDENETWTGGTSGATGTSTSGTDYQGEADESDHDTAQLAAESLRRDVIQKVGGASCTGRTRGVNVFNSNVYAFRDNAAENACLMWKATTAGWVQVDLGYKIRFSAGSLKPVIGDTVTGASSGASCTIRRVVLTEGMWAGGDGVGFIVTDAITAGPFTAAENLEVGGEVIGVFSSSEAQSLPNGGKYKFRNFNFGGNVSSYAMYGINGVGNAFEYDGTTFTLIETGMAIDAPKQIGLHKGQLLLAFAGGSLQHSGKNDPLSFQPVLGANELLAGDEITGFIEEVGDVTFVFTRNYTFALSGFVQENIQLKRHNIETGAFENTMQRIGKSLYLDDRGFSSIPTTDAFGDFASNQISVLVDPLIQNFLKEADIQDSMIHRGKSIYRCFFSNNEAISIGFSGNKVNGIMTIDWGLTVTATSNGPIADAENVNGIERVFVGTEDGWVYETDVGRNFNGEPIEAYIVTAYHFSGTPELSKRYRRATIYMEGEGRVTQRVLADYDYNEDPLNFEEIMNRAVALGGGRYGISRHGAFSYSAASKTDIRVSMNSHARNVSMIFYHNEANEEPHSIHAIHFHLSGRRIIRS